MFDLSDFISNHVTGRQESLFEADLSQHQAALSEQVNGRSILVIGGAGSIGTSFIKALLKFQPARLFVVDYNENGLAELVRDLRSSLGYHIPLIFQTYPVDFGDAVFEKILRQEGPFEIVANFAAHKHVRSEKDQYAVEAMLHNNVFKTRHLLELLATHKPQHFFCVSTDKAANPVNVMGASKKLMEQVLIAYSTEIPIASARFANVAFSNGSLLAGFLERLKKRQPLSAPEDVARYFVSPEESGQLCLLACLLAQPGELFFPKLDARQDLRSFSAIAVDLLQTMGYAADFCESEQEAREKAARLHPASTSWPVYFFKSDTSGEKSVEHFFTEAEKLDLQRFKSIGVVENPERALENPLLKTNQMLAELKAVLAEKQLDKSALIAILCQLVPDFQHLETGKNLDQKM